jgi:hypothetical protein
MRMYRQVIADGFITRAASRRAVDFAAEVQAPTF